MSKVPISQKAHQFRVTLRELSPQVWRRIQVPSRYSFWDLHVAIQDAMGWLDCHLHVFKIPNPKTGRLDQVGIPLDDSFEEDIEFLPGWDVNIADYFQKAGDMALYQYDFGDRWEHDVVLEEVVVRVKGERYPRCLAGARRCPPEDCGGPSGYMSFLEQALDPTHEEHARSLEWAGGSFDPAGFEPENVRFDNPTRRWKIAFSGDQS